jgi:murein DD-endopeptidase MepM/ murein hydrolase activator NlpD
MKKLYYFSKTKLQFVEISNYKSKLTVLFSLSLILCSAILFGGYYFLLSPSSSNIGYSTPMLENQYLKEKLEEVTSLYGDLNEELDSLKQINQDLRIAANLPPISEDESLLGVGGGSFDNELDFMQEPANLQLGKLLSYVEDVSRKLRFEKSQYEEISNKLAENEKLYASIPAIKPSNGTVALHGFGMRVHPILKMNKMHDGIDIITDVGTSVFAPGNGVVDFVGYKGGYGLTVEIDHGFGYRTLFAHLSEENVKEGQKLTRGKLIGKSGNSGLSSGPHLHYEVHHNGVKQDPSEFFFDDMGFFEITKKN